MRVISLVVAIVLLAVPASAQSTGSSAIPQLGPGPAPRQSPPPRFPMPRRGPAIPSALTEDDWGRWLLSTREQRSQCIKVAAVSGLVATAGLVALKGHPASPGPMDLAAGQPGKKETFYRALGTTAVLGGGLTFLGTSRCATTLSQTVRQLEVEGRRRGYSSPAPATMTSREWLVRMANARSAATYGMWMTMGGTAAMMIGGSAIHSYQPAADQRGLKRLGPGGVVALLGFSATVVGTATWAFNAAEVRSLERRQPGPGTAVTIAPTPGGVRIGTVFRF